VSNWRELQKSKTEVLEEARYATDKSTYCRAYDSAS
jgi:hypothetical protein